MTLMETAQLLGNFGEFFGAIAVVATLIYLSLQIRQNTHQVRRAEMNAAYAQFSVPRMAIASDRGLAEVAIKGFRSSDPSNPSDPLDAVDQYRLHMLYMENMMANFHSWDRARVGSIERSDWEESERPRLMGLLSVDAVSRWWDDNRHVFTVEFRAEIDRIRDH